MKLYLYPSTIIQFRTDGHYTGQCTLVLLAYLHHFTAPQYNNTRYVCFWNVLEYRLRIEWVTRSTQLIFILLENRNCMSNTASGWNIVSHGRRKYQNMYIKHGLGRMVSYLVLRRRSGPYRKPSLLITTNQQRWFPAWAGSDRRRSTK